MRLFGQPLLVFGGERISCVGVTVNVHDLFSSVPACLAAWDVCQGLCSSGLTVPVRFPAEGKMRPSSMFKPNAEEEAADGGEFRKVVVGDDGDGPPVWGQVS